MADSSKPDEASVSGNQADNLDEFIRWLEPELRVGGGATLDELYNLAVAIRDDFAVITARLSQRLSKTGADDV